ncbi:MAG: dUTP diphosphatase [archaeon]
MNDIIQQIDSLSDKIDKLTEMVLHFRQPNIKILYLDNYNFEWPEISKTINGDIGFDLRAAIPEAIRINRYETVLIPNGFSIELPEYVGMEIIPRSGLANKEDLIIPNSPGLIDTNYRGEIKTGLRYIGYEAFKIILPGERISQAKFFFAPNAVLKKVQSLSDTERGNGGFGHTGV